MQDENLQGAVWGGGVQVPVGQGLHVTSTSSVLYLQTQDGLVTVLILSQVVVQHVARCPVGLLLGRVFCPRD